MKKLLDTIDNISLKRAQSSQERRTAWRINSANAHVCFSSQALKNAGFNINKTCTSSNRHSIENAFEKHDHTLVDVINILNQLTFSVPQLSQPKNLMVSQVNAQLGVVNFDAWIEE